jgi:N-acylneuraminate cytidylyltransferase
MGVGPILAVIPARGGSKGVVGKNIKLFAGMPLIAHSIRFAETCPEIDRCIVSTDCQEIAAVAKQNGGEVPFMRPAELAQDNTPSWPVIRHALLEMERIASSRFESILLLQPTSPARRHEDLTAAIELLDSDPRADGVVAVSEPPFNPRWVSVEERGGYVVPAFDNSAYSRRQDVPKNYRINGLYYLWRRSYVVDNETQPKLDQARCRMLIIPDERAIDIDHLLDFTIGELLITAKVVTLPWLQKSE